MTNDINAPHCKELMRLMRASYCDPPNESHCRPKTAAVIAYHRAHKHEILAELASTSIEDLTQGSQMEITQQEISDLANSWYEAQYTALRKALDAVSAPFIGRVIKQVIGLGSKKAGTLGKYTVDVTITEGGHGPEGCMVLWGTYTHPLTGKIAKTAIDVY